MLLQAVQGNWGQVIKAGQGACKRSRVSVVRVPI